MAIIGLLVIFACILRASSSEMGGFGGKMGKEWCDVDPNEFVFTFGVLRLCQFCCENSSIKNASVRVREEGHTDRGKLVYNLSHAICYSCWTEKNTEHYFNNTVNNRDQLLSITD